MIRAERGRGERKRERERERLCVCVYYERYLLNVEGRESERERAFIMNDTH